MSYRAELTASALRSLQRVPPRVAEPLVAFIFGSLAEEPKTRGKPLRGQFEGTWSARRGDWRILFDIDDEAHAIRVLRISHRSEAYRSR